MPEPKKEEVQVPIISETNSNSNINFNFSSPPRNTSTSTYTPTSTTSTSPQNLESSPNKTKPKFVWKGFSQAQAQLGIEPGGKIGSVSNGVWKGRKPARFVVETIPPAMAKEIGKEGYALCPFNNLHFMPFSSLKKHFMMAHFQEMNHYTFSMEGENYVLTLTKPENEEPQFNEPPKQYDEKGKSLLG